MARKSKRSQRRRTTAGAVGLLVCAALIFGGVAALALGPGPGAVDEATLCREDELLTDHTVVLVDGSDALTANHAAILEAAVAEEIDTLPTFGKLTIVAISADQPWSPVILVSLCNPGSARAASWLWQNPRRIDKAWRERFKKPIDATVAALSRQPSADTSPIMEAITAITWRPDFDVRVERRRLRIVSDLLQHNAGHSHYASGDLWDDYGQSGIARSTEAALDGVAVRIDYLQRPQAAGHQGKRHHAFWRRWLTSRGAAEVQFGARPATSGGIDIARKVP